MCVVRFFLMFNFYSSIFLVYYLFGYGCFTLDCFFFFFKQKTAYEMRISDWSSDVCSSDLHDRADRARLYIGASGDHSAGGREIAGQADVRHHRRQPPDHRNALCRAWEGAAKGDVTVVEFFDYACGYCRASLPDLARLVGEDKGEIGRAQV